LPTFLVDSNVLLDVITQDPVWSAWSTRALQQAVDSGRVLINPVVYGEVSVRFTTVEELDESLPADVLDREDIPYAAAFLAGKCFVEYRRRGGARASTLPDFFIGAHAAVGGHTLITRDPARYRTYFPTLPVIAPPDKG